MLVSVFSPKGGSGTSVGAGLFAKCLSEYEQTLLVETNRGDLEAIVGHESDSKYGFADWVSSPEPNSENLSLISTTVYPNLKFVPGFIAEPDMEASNLNSGQLLNGYVPANVRSTVVESLQLLPGHVVVDCSLAASNIELEIANSSDVVIVVVRQCYLALWRAMNHPLKNKADVCVVVCEPGRSITPTKIAETLDVVALIEIDARRDFAKTIDAGVLLHRTPEKLVGPIRSYVHDLIEESYSDSDESQSEAIEHLDVFDDCENANANDFWKGNRIEIAASSSPSKQSEYARHSLSVLKGR